MSATAKWTLTVLAVLALLTAGARARLAATGLPGEWTPSRRVEVRVLRDATEASEEFGERSLEDAMPSSLALRSFGEDHDVKLRLRRQPLLKVRENLEDVGSEVTALPDAAVYTDPELGATVMVRRHSGGHFSMEGRWEHEDREVHISPVADHTTRRSADSSVAHVVEEYPRLVPKLDRRSLREKRGTLFVVEMVWVCDFLNYEMFKKWFKTNTTAEMTLYYTLMAQDLFRRYASIKSVKIEIRVLQLLIMTSADKSPWSSKNVDRSNPIMATMDGVKALSEFVMWLADQYGEIPDADNYATFTAQVAMHNANGGVGGLAAFDISCGIKGSSIQLVRRRFAKDTLTLAHEVGHNLGMQHTFETTDCKTDEGYIMSGVNYVPLNWHFSSCSIESLIDHVLKFKHCLMNDDKETVLWDDKFEGEKYLDANAQCALRLKGGKWDGKNLKDICHTMTCCPSDKGECRRMQPLDYTGCGSGKWCWQGKCVFKLVNGTTTD